MLLQMVKDKNFAITYVVNGSWGKGHSMYYVVRWLLLFLRSTSYTHLYHLYVM
jgi:hypothetical protein